MGDSSDGNTEEDLIVESSNLFRRQTVQYQQTRTSPYDSQQQQHPPPQYHPPPPAQLAPPPQKKHRTAHNELHGNHDINIFKHAVKELMTKKREGASYFHLDQRGVESRDVEFIGMDPNNVASIRLKMKDYERMTKFKLIIAKLKSEVEKKVRKNV